MGNFWQGVMWLGFGESAVAEQGKFVMPPVTWQAAVQIGGTFPQALASWQAYAEMQTEPVSPDEEADPHAAVPVTDPADQKVEI